MCSFRVMVSTDWSVPDRKLLVTVTGFGIAYLVLLFLGLEWKYNRGLDVISGQVSFYIWL